MFLKRQEIVSFNPELKTHRAAVRSFMKRRAWVDSPLRFMHDPSYGSVAEQVQSKLLDWYIAQEEAKLNKIKKTKITPNVIASMGKVSQLKKKVV